MTLKIVFDWSDAQRPAIVCSHWDPYIAGFVARFRIIYGIGLAVRFND